MVSITHPPVFGSAIGSKVPATVPIRGIFVRVIEVRLSMRACAKDDITVRRAAMALLLLETTRVPASPRLAIPRTARAIDTSMSVMPRMTWRLSVFKTAPPEVPAEQTARRRPAPVHARADQRSLHGRRVQPEDALVGDDHQRSGFRVQHRRAAGASGVRQVERGHVVVQLVRRRREQQAIARAAQVSASIDLRHRARGGVEEDRKSTRLNSSHRCISYAVFCLKKKKK